ncbi:MAG: ABC-F family ATP-binding cassette domain-containing protein, partial [Bacteroidales bacterium]|nr:ABC-F family ATP-binding cassette domain-containing protein [Bacteroidales bacterium]
RLRDILGAFLFKGEDIDKRVAVLSGGERARLGMACLMLQPYNVLALDEPTNHMDIRSKDVLKQALKAFDGTLIVVSHDRDFLEGLVDKLYEFRDGKVKEHLGGIDSFLRQRRLESLSQLERRDTAVEKTATEQPRQDKREAFERSRADDKAMRKLRNRVDYLVKECTKADARLAEIEKILANPGNNDDILDLTREYLETQRSRDAFMDEWTTLMEQMEN